MVAKKCFVAVSMLMVLHAQYQAMETVKTGYKAWEVSKTVRGWFANRTFRRAVASTFFAGVTYIVVDRTIESNDGLHDLAGLVSFGHPGLLKLGCAGVAGGVAWSNFSFDVKKEVAECNEKVTAVDEKVTGVAHDVAQTRKDVSGVDERVGAVQVNIAGIKDQVGAAQEKLGELGTAVDGVTADAKAIKDILAAHDENWHALLPRVEEHGGTLHQLQNKINDEVGLQEAHRQLVHGELTDLSAKVTAIEGKLERIVATVEAVELQGKQRGAEKPSLLARIVGK